MTACRVTACRVPARQVTAGRAAARRVPACRVTAGRYTAARLTGWFQGGHHSDRLVSFAFAVQGLGWFTARSPHAGQKAYVYLDKDRRPMLRPFASTAAHPGAPCCVAFRVLMYLMWGPPPPVPVVLPSGEVRIKRAVACHFACDHHNCLNPFHGRWGTDGDNNREQAVLKEYWACLKRMPTTELREEYKAEHNPAQALMCSQGLPFPWERS